LMTLESPVVFAAAAVVEVVFMVKWERNVRLGRSKSNDVAFPPVPGATTARPHTGEPDVF
jgi:hypothetical protein